MEVDDVGTRERTIGLLRENFPWIPGWNPLELFRRFVSEVGWRSLLQKQECGKDRIEGPRPGLHFPEAIADCVLREELRRLLTLLFRAA